jgi:epoxyqueuosine reductase QueG
MEERPGNQEVPAQGERRLLAGDGRLSAEALRRLCLEAGAQDAGFVEVERDALSAEREDILRVYPRTRAVISIVKSVNRESVRSPSVAVADHEFHAVNTELPHAARRIIEGLKAAGVRGVSVPPGFPMDMTRWPGKIWDIAHKPVAVQAGLGHMGIHRVVIHPRLGSQILLGSILIDTAVDRYDRPLEDNPCIRCRLCVSVCPVGAIAKDGEFTFLSCLMHNYHELIGGFQEWVEALASARSAGAYRARFRDSETLMKWQSLTYADAYRCSYCLAVCPAGEGALASYEPDKKGYVESVVRPLKEKEEPVYVIPGTAAEKTARTRPGKDIPPVRNTVRPVSIPSFLEGVKLAFNSEAAKGLHLIIAFTFTGKEQAEVTIAITDGKLDVREGHADTADLRVTADSETWVRMLNEEVSQLRAIITGKLKVKGNPLRMRDFTRCIS